MNDVEPRHPEVMTMAAFVEGTLAPHEIAAVASHLRGCSDCRTVVSETARFEREEVAREVTPRSARAWWLPAAAVLAAIAITLPLLRWMGTRNASPIARLIEVAPRQHRSVAGRLSGFRWAQLQAPPRGEPIPDFADLKLTGAAGEVLEKTAGQLQPESRHATGVAYLLINRRSDSINALEQAANGSTDPRVWNDLAVARYAVATQDEHRSQLPLALADADHALRLDPKFAEALFNRALILEHLGIRDQARKAWQAYLAVDSGSAWSVEARLHLRELEKTSRRFDPKMLETAPVDQLVREFPQEARTWAEVSMLAAWADAESANDASAPAKLARVHAIADALAAFNGERLLSDAVGAIERSTGNARAALVQGHRVYIAARLDYSHRHPSAAEPQFRHAAEWFARGASPMASVAAYYAANTVLDQNLGDQAHDELTLLLPKIDAQRYRALSAQIHWELAVYANGAGDSGTGAREARTASSIFRVLGEQDHAATLDGIAAMALELIGQSDLAWSHRLQCFAQLSATGERQKLGTILRNAASTLAAFDHDAAAAAIIGLTTEDGDGDSAQISLHEADEARFLARSGDLERARLSLSNARAKAATVSDAALSERVSRQIDLADATLADTGDARGAINSLDRSIAFFTQRHASVDLAETYLLRARRERAIGHGVAALADLTRALNAVETQGEKIRDGESRLRFLDVAAQIIDETIDLHLSRGEVQHAFDVADRSRRLPARSAPTLPPAARPLSGDIALVEYAVLSHSVVAFCMTNHGLVAHRIEIDRHDLKNRIATFIDLIRSRAPIADIAASGSALHHLLIEPLLPQLAGVQEIVFVSDRQLYALPFAALWDSSREVYLAEEFTIRFAPSATLEPETAESLHPALVTSDPPTASLPRLPASAQEASGIAALYRDATMLTGKAATRAAFTEAATRSALIHFAGHANSDASDAYGALLLAADGSDSGVVGANDVSRFRLDRHPLVVLAACGTFRGNAEHVTGMSSLARAFLVAGARGVVGTLWEIDDDVSAPLFLRLHQHLLAGASPARALRQTQVDLLHSADPRLAHPATWAPAESLNID
jgi:CHAT domain-containing protein